MKKMQEDEFDKVQPTTKIGEVCSHDIVKLYNIMGTHSDYGCIKCKIKSLVLEILIKKVYKSNILKNDFNKIKGE